MKKSPRLLLLLAVLALLPWAPVSGQDDTNPEAQPPAGSTVITSDELHSDQVAHNSIFTGKVIVVGTNFHMTCQEMTVYFTNDNKVIRIVAIGDVVIVQPDRVTHCGHAEYFHDSDTFDLTDQPVILDHKNQVNGPEIIIERTTQKMIVKGGRSKVILENQSLGPTTPATPTDAK